MHARKQKQDTQVYTKLHRNFEIGQCKCSITQSIKKAKWIAPTANGCPNHQVTSQQASLSIVKGTLNNTATAFVSVGAMTMGPMKNDMCKAAS